jgi:hypothetical protein
MADHNAWAEAGSGFLFHNLVRTIMQTHLRWAPTIKAMRLVSRAWRDGVSQAVPLLAPKPAACTSDVAMVPEVFSGTQILRLESLVAHGPPVDELLERLAERLPSISALLLLNCFVTARGMAALSRWACRALNQLESSFLPGVINHPLLLGVASQSP